MPGSATVKIGEKEWLVAVAAPPSEIAAGLGGVASIPAQTGMLFDLGGEQALQVTTEPMLFNIDVIFISEDLKVVDVEVDVAPGNIVSEATPVRYFLEVNAGEATDVEPEDSVEITDYIYTPPEATNEWVLSITPIIMLGFICAMVGGMARAMATPLKCKSCGSRIVKGEIYYRTPKGVYCSRCVPTEYTLPKYRRVKTNPGSSSKQLGGSKQTNPKTYADWEKLGEEIKLKDPESAWEVDRALRYIKLQYDYPQLGDPTAKWQRLLLAKAKEVKLHSNPGGASSSIATVTCPICHKVIEIPLWNEVSRSDALLEHIEKEHSSYRGTFTVPGTGEKYEIRR